MLVCVYAHLTKRSKVALMFAGSVMCNKQSVAARRQLKLYDVDLDSVSFMAAVKMMDCVIFVKL